MKKEKLYYIEQNDGLFTFYIYDGETIKTDTVNETGAKLLEAYLNEHGYILTNN